MQCHLSKMHPGMLLFSRPLFKFDWVEWIVIREKKRKLEKEEWNIQQESETVKEKRLQPDIVSAWSLSNHCVPFFFFLPNIFHFLFPLLFCETPLSEMAEVVQPSHLTGPKHSLCSCECQSKRSAWQGLPWVTLHRLVCACEMDNSLGSLSGLMTRFPGICAAVLWPGSPSKELCYGAVLPLHCYCFNRYGSTGG